MLDSGLLKAMLDIVSEMALQKAGDFSAVAV